MIKKIESVQNPAIKKIIALKAKAALRKSEGLCVIEGFKELEVAALNGVEILELYYMESFGEKIEPAVFEKARESIEISLSVMEKIALREHYPVAIARIPQHVLDDIALPQNPLVLILNNIEKPGNIGALLRTADAAGVDLVLCADMQTDLFNPNVIRNSLGCVFSTPIFDCSDEVALAFLHRHQIQVISTYLFTKNTYYQVDMKQSVAIVLGNEHRGISDFWLNNATHAVKIPMKGKVDSMNVSNSAAIMLYEAVRQRTLSDETIHL